MALADIKEKILAEAKKEKDSVLGEAKKEQEQILAGAKKVAGATKKENDEKLQKEIPLVVKRREAVAGLDVRKYMLSAKRELIEKAFEASAQNIEKLPKEKYLAFMNTLLEGAVESGNEEVLLGEEETLLDASWIEAFNEKTGKKITLAKEKTPRGKRGFVLRNNLIEVNCTIRTLLRSVRDDLEADVAKRLFANL
ncbi:MAG TPA: V-type ATP synthase subunit E family protein [Synergistaceae bacterium]|nr:V-type ATP synthase subunit E family protein [Synergistaceae bacterium]HPJ26054.1 V-type ATP synthase subunit E family protein [Synergistaceae bacterium]HPQ38194.1 V-type ATP synthase subunit E family protein [Synergistaceae bacterium]